MNNLHVNKTAIAVSAILAASVAFIEAPLAEMVPHKQTHAIVRPPKPASFKAPHRVAPAIPREEPNVTNNAGLSTSAAFSSSPNSVTPNTTTLSAPVTLTYGGSSNAFQLNDSGTARGLSASITNTSDISSALYGDTVGAGAGLTGFNKGTVGPGGKFQVTNANSAQAGAFASTIGTGPAILGTITNTASNYPAIYGQNTTSASAGWGMEGDGNIVGVEGYVTPSSTIDGTAAIYGVNDNTATSVNNWAIYGVAGSAIGVGAESDSNYGLSATSYSNYAVYATSSTGSAIYAESDSSSYSAYGVYATVGAGNAVQAVATATEGFGVYAQSTNGIGVYAVDTGSGAGIYATSSTGNAGTFAGNVDVTGQLTVGSTVYTSDRNLKTGIAQIDSKDLLERVSHLPISTWTYKNAPDKRHVGPMAQDFHAAFGLNGGDDTHISEVDIAGVSLAAIQELDNEMKIKDAQIAELKAQASEQTKAMARMVESFSARVAALEHQSAATAQTAALKFRPNPGLAIQ